MRALLTIVVCVGSILSLNSPADAARKSKRSAQPPYYFVPPSSNLREQALCEERAQNLDPAGRYAGYPCWARETFSRQPR
jgi:hypothetical protein